MSLLRAPIYQTRPALRLAPSDALFESALGRTNRSALERLLRERAADPGREFWIGLVPGASEQWGHHRAPPRSVEARGVRIGREFAARLTHGYQLLARGLVRYLLISGGSVDARRPDYNEAERGREALLAMFAHEWHADALADRVLIDPIARHSTTNVRNADKLCQDLGLDRLLIATTMPPTRLLWPVMLPVLYQTTQGWYYLHHRVSTFDWRSRRELGYALGAFDWFAHDRAGAVLRAIAHHDFAHAHLRDDAYGP